MTEIRGGRVPKDSPARSLPLYDTPYEPEELTRESDSGVSLRETKETVTRESRLPQDDERPAEEYDQPWEWKKERISKAFAALLCYDCISDGDLSRGAPRREKPCTVEVKALSDLPWPPPVGQLSSTHPPVDVSDLSEAPSSPQTISLSSNCDPQQQIVQCESVENSCSSRPLQRHSSACLVNTKTGSLESSSTHSTYTNTLTHSQKTNSLESSTLAIAERIDPSLPLQSQSWFHGSISRTDAESLLRLCKEASYLVRNSQSCKNDYSLSLKSTQGFMHMKLSRTKDNKYVLGQNSSVFDSVPEIIHFYSSRKLPIKGAEHMSLLYPVAIRTL
ncbi:hypothetical protein DNTS_000432 [Danionella cerebrum]|uniref:SH2 domain-containing protein n=1 Tax=Danionella cerebrum TaxID=2873325 RepID=A0A553QZR3_9TELE|nr:hypothetical protein DNTS_000432 [Danionella translucida]TRY95457.1 hypothetical protein DNTS_000432 [Danionella translucida]